MQYASTTGDKHVREFAPVFVVVIDHQRDLRILCDIAQAFELCRRSVFRFFVDRRVEAFAIEGKADRNHMRLSGSVGRGEMSDTGGAD